MGKREKTGVTGAGRGWRSLVLKAALLLAAGGAAHGQEALRMSLASEEAAEARKQAAELGYCNLRFLSVTARLQLYSQFDYNDNVNFSGVKPEDDFVLHAGMNIKSLWPITDFNSLYLSTGLGYSKFMKNSSLDSPYITPDSAIMFKMYTGDFAIDVHDRFSLIQNGSQAASVNSASGFDRLKNSVGAGVDWDLNKLIISGGYDHDLLMATKSDYDYVNRNSDLLSSRAMFTLSPTFSAGLTAAGGVTYYQTNTFPNNTYFSVGPEATAQFSKFLKVKAGAGWVHYSFDQAPPGVDFPSSMDSYYARLSINHQLTQRISHSLTVQHELSTGEWWAVGNLYTVSYQANWALNDRLRLIGSVYYANGDAWSPGKNKIEWISPGLDLTYRLGPKLLTSLGYHYAESMGSSQYKQNRVSLSATYTF